MKMKERKIRKAGNSLSLTLSKEFLDSIGVQVGDRVLVDESQLVHAIQKVDDTRELDQQVDFLMRQSLRENDAVYRELVDK